MTIARHTGLADESFARGRFRTGIVSLKQRRTLMESSHVTALQAKHEGLERRLREELARPVPDSTMIQALKRQKLKLKEELSLN
jgi:hypothetical protein